VHCWTTNLSQPSGSGGGGSSYVDSSTRGYGITEGARTGDGAVYIDFQDNVAPAAAPVVWPAPNGNGWNNTDVSVSVDWSDIGVGIDPNNCGHAGTTVSGPGVSSVHAECADLSGNVGRIDVPIRIDKQGPKATWNIRADRYVEWHWTDDRSGVDTQAYCVDFSAPGAPGSQVSASCSDKAGNETTVTITVP
jgi:hypothetical protein